VHISLVGSGFSREHVKLHHYLPPFD